MQIEPFVPEGERRSRAADTVGGGIAGRDTYDPVLVSAVIEVVGTPNSPS